MDKKERPKLKLVGLDGNAFAIMARASKALRRAGYTREEVDQYLREARAGDYYELLAVTMSWCDCD